MNATLYPLCAVVAWIFVVRRAPQLAAMRRHPDRLATWFMFLFFALTFTTGWAVVWDLMDSWTGLKESSTLITQCCVICFSASVLSLLQLWSYPTERARRHVRYTIIGASLVLTVMVALFLRSDTQHQHQNKFADWYGGSAQYVAYLLVYLTVFTAALLEIARLCWRYARLTTRGWLHRGLVTAAVGAVVGLLYSSTRLADVVAAHYRLDLYRLENLAEVGAGAGALLVMIGLTMPTWGPRASRLVRRLRRLYAYPKLRPLWVAFYRRDPSIALEDGPPATAPRTGAPHHSVVRVMRDPDYYVGRRIVEIRDGILSLHPNLDATVAERARIYYRQHLTGAELGAAVEAARIRIGLEQNAAPANQTPNDAVLLNHTPADLDAEIAWLVKVAKYFQQYSDDLPRILASHTSSIGDGR